MRLIIVSGRSGSGKSTALDVLEDNGFYCIDNLPAGLLPDLAERFLPHSDMLLPQVAVSIDARNLLSQLKRFPELLEEVRQRNIRCDVLYLDAEGNLHRQAAKLVCVAGNAIETPRLLHLSSSSLFPDGLANSSGLVGRNYMRHTTGSVYATFEQPVKMWRGTTMAGIIRDEARHDPSRGFVGGYELETLSLGLPFMAAFLDPGGWGREFTTALDSYANMAGMWIVGEDMPQTENRVTLSDTTDKFGLKVANVNFSDHPNDIAMRNHAYKQGQAIYKAVGATRTLPTPPYPSTHNLGTNRMSERPEDGVVDRNGRAHDVPNLFVSDGSQFTTGAAENPTLTIVALAIRQADHIAREMAAGNV